MLVAVLLSTALAAALSQAEDLARFEASLRPHPYLGRVTYTRIDDFAPFYFFIKRPDSDESGYYQRVAGEYGPWFRELERLFVAQYVEPLGLERRPGSSFYSIFVLDSSGAYKDYADAARTTGLYAARAHYDPTLGLAVTFENAYQPESRSKHRRAALHELTHALQHAYFSERERLPEVAWFNEGLADYLSYCDGLMPPALGEAKRPDPEALEIVAAVSELPGALQDGLFPLEELATLRDYAEVERQALARSGGVERTVAGGRIALPLFYAQSNLWTFFLHNGEDSRNRSSYQRYARLVWKGESGLAPLHAAFEGIDLAELDRSFLKWLGEAIFQRLHVAVTIPSEPKHQGNAVAEAVPAPVVRASPFVATELEPDTTDPNIALALALAEARRGALTSAEERLRLLAASAPESLRARVERELGRVRAFRDLRQRFFEHIAKPGARKLDIDFDGKKLLAQVTALEGERIRLGSNRRGLEALELERLPILQVAELMRDKKFGFEAGPAAAWAYVLARDERWKKLVLAADPLYADAERDYPERMAVAQAADTLAHLAATGIPADAATADVTLQSIEELLREYSALALVSRRLSALRALAQAALDRLFESGGLASCLAGKLEDLGRGGVRLSYDFDTPLELSDFTQTGYLSSRALDRPRHDFEVSKGCLTTHGFACLRSRIAFQGPQRVRCRARYALPNGSYDPRFLFLLACNDDGLVSFAATDFGGSLQVIDMVRNYVKQSPGSAQIVVGEAYQLELIFDGSDLTASVNGMARGSVSAGPRKSGSVFLFTAADFTISVEELVLEGTPTPESLAGLRNAWSAGRLTALGFE